MDAIVLKALVKDPDYRYQSADEMRADIEACLDGRPVAATAAMGAAGYGGYDGYGQDQPTTALRAADQHGAQTSMLPPVNPDDGGYGYDDRPDRRRQKKSNTSTILLIAAGILVLIGAILIGKSVFGGDNSDNGKVDVPNMVGSTVGEAKDLATNAGVLLKVGSREPCEDQPNGKICSQTPKDGQMRENETVTVVVSTGAPKIEVPDVTNQSEDEARKTLEEKGFTVLVVASESADAEPDTVLDQKPKGGTKAERDSEVKITVAREKTQNIPPVVGRSYDQAVAQLNGAGFQNVSQTPVDSDKPAGEVIGQSPSPTDGKKPLDTPIVLKVSKGPAQPEQVTIPGDIYGKRYQDVKAQLEGMGLVVALAPNSVDKPGATVVNSTPAPTSSVAKGSTVNLLTVGGGGDGNIFGGPSGWAN